MLLILVPIFKKEASHAGHLTVPSPALFDLLSLSPIHLNLTWSKQFVTFVYLWVKWCPLFLVNWPWDCTGSTVQQITSHPISLIFCRIVLNFEFYILKVQRIQCIETYILSYSRLNFKWSLFHCQSNFVNFRIFSLTL